MCARGRDRANEKRERGTDRERERERGVRGKEGGKEREREVAGQPQHTRSKTRYKTRDAAWSGRDQVRISNVDRADAPRREIAAINRKCVTSSIVLSLALSFSISLSACAARRSVNQAENPQELRIEYSIVDEAPVTLGGILPAGKNVITACASLRYACRESLSRIDRSICMETTNPQGSHPSEPARRR